MFRSQTFRSQMSAAQYQTMFQNVKMWFHILGKLWVLFTSFNWREEGDGLIHQMCIQHVYSSIRSSRIVSRDQLSCWKTEVFKFGYHA
jgi:hypothetical protein